MKIFKIGDAESPWHLYFLFFILRSRDSSMQQQRDLPIQRNNEDLHTNFRWSRRLYSGNASTRYFVKSFRIYLIKTTSLWRAPFNQNTTADKNYWGPWISILFADVAVYADVAHIELLAHNQLSPSTHVAGQSSLDTHNQAYGLKCNRKSRVLRASKCRTGTFCQ